MADVFLNDIMLVTVQGTCFGQRFMLTHTLKATIVTGSQSIITAQGDVLDKLEYGGSFDVVAPYAACLSTSCTVDLITAQRINSTRMRTVKRAQSRAGSMGQAEVTNLAAAITFVTQFGGRNQIANKHIGPLATGTSDTLINNGMLTATYLETFGELADALLAAPTSNSGNVTWTPCVVHRNPETGLISGSDVYDSYFIKGTVSSQRTRIIGKGK